MKTVEFIPSKVARFTFAVLFSALSLTLPARAGMINEPDPATAAKLNNAQMGIRYWIELKRQGKVKYVTNQQNFMSGDQIRFHVQPTVDGFAYIVLRSGSQGEQAVLFPMEKSKDNNRLHRLVDYALPSDDWLTFDEHPGTEKVTLLFSKSAIDSNKVMTASSGSSGSNHVVLKATTGSKDLIPAHTTVVYQQAAELPNAPVDGAPDDATLAAIAAATAPTNAVQTIATAVPVPVPRAVPTAEPTTSTAIATTVSKTTPATPSASTTTVSTTTASAGATTAGSSTTKTATTISTPSSTVVDTFVAKSDAKRASSVSQATETATKKNESQSENKIDPKSELASQAINGGKSANGAVLVRQDDSEKVLHIDVDLEHSG